MWAIVLSYLINKSSISDTALFFPFYYPMNVVYTLLTQWGWKPLMVNEMGQHNGKGNCLRAKSEALETSNKPLCYWLWHKQCLRF